MRIRSDIRELILQGEHEKKRARLYRIMKQEYRIREIRRILKKLKYGKTEKQNR